MILRFDSDECRDLERALTREWLVTNDLGGYASGTLAGINTRRYHGLLVAALHPPVQRVVLVADLEDWFAPDDKAPVALFAHEYPDETIDPRGFDDLAEVRVDGMIPTFRWRIAGRVLERRTWMDPGANRTVVTYRLLRGHPGRLRLRPLLAGRPADQQRTQPAETTVESVIGGFVVQLDGQRAWLTTSPAAEVRDGPDWIGPFFRRAERLRGLDAEEILFTPGTITLPIRAGAPAALVLSAEPDVAAFTPVTSLLVAGAAQRAAPAGAASTGRGGAIARQLTIAARQFRAVRLTGDPPHARRTILAGYPWFSDWGRDTMIALRGVTLAAGVPDEARSILATFLGALDQGMLPNAYHDPGTATEYNSVDGTLWMFQALHHYLEATDDWPFLRDHLDALEGVIDWHTRGTRFGIRMDERDGLLRAGQPGHALTWMDAKDEGWVVTPRIGKPVEIAALWFNALHLLAQWRRRDGRDPRKLVAMADRARESAHARYWYADGGYLFDVIDGPDGDDPSLRPNQLIALGLVEPLVDGEYARAALDVVTRKLLTPYGLRTLSPDDPRYRSRFGGDHRNRDGAYQMGIVWPWLIGPYLDAHRRIHGNTSIATRILEPFRSHFREAGIGSVSEIFEAEPPFRPVGAIAQAWSVGELLWHARGGQPPG